MAEPTRLARKLSAATITNKTKDQYREICAADKTKAFPQYSVYGVARGFKTGTGQYGDWLAVTGEFEACDLGTGEIHNSGRYFPPPYVADLLTPALIAGGENSAIEFALVVGVKYAENAFGFEYYADTYRDPGESDSIKRLKALVPDPQVLLAGPKPSGAASKPVDKEESKT